MGWSLSCVHVLNNFKDSSNSEAKEFSQQMFKGKSNINHFEINNHHAAIHEHVEPAFSVVKYK